MSIEMVGDVAGWFRERLVSCLSARQIRVAEETEFYLVELLASAARRGAEGRGVGARPLALALAEANEAEGDARLERYRALGDEALYVGGFFVEHLDRRGLSEDYVHRIGSGAYRVAGRLAERSVAESARAVVYEELAARFERLARVFDDVRESTALRTPQDIVRLYDKWRRTGSARLAERLFAEGVFPGRASSTLH